MGDVNGKSNCNDAQTISVSSCNNNFSILYYSGGNKCYYYYYTLIKVKNKKQTSNEL